jgi:hypothetical protein
MFDEHLEKFLKFLLKRGLNWSKTGIIYALCILKSYSYEFIYGYIFYILFLL